MVIAVSSVAAPGVNAQLSTSPPASECVRHTADGHCALWQPDFVALLRHPDLYRGLRVRLEGYVILKCQDQTLYRTAEDAANFDREAGLRLFGNLTPVSGLPASISHVLVELRLQGAVIQDAKSYPASADSIALVRVIPAGHPIGD
ncbi:MAG: hypothetical protein ACREL4_11405 [Gemmatimonadales bacterium]